MLDAMTWLEVTVSLPAPMPMEALPEIAVPSVRESFPSPEVTIREVVAEVGAVTVSAPDVPARVAAVDKAEVV